MGTVSQLSRLTQFLKMMELQGLPGEATRLQDVLMNLERNPLSAQDFLIAPGHQTRMAIWTLMTQL